MYINLNHLSGVLDISQSSVSFIETRSIYFDSRATFPEGIFFPLKGANFDGEAFIQAAMENGAARFFSSQAFPDQDYIRLLVPGEEALGKIASYVRSLLKGIVIGITGTSGKTTLKEILSRMLSVKYKVHSTRGNFNNLLGLPMSVLGVEGDEDFCVFELGTNQPGEIRQLAKLLKPEVSFITSIGRGHTEFLQDVNGVYQEKREIIASTAKIFFTGECNGYGAELCRYASEYGLEAFNIESEFTVTDIDLEAGTRISKKDADGHVTSFVCRLFGSGNIGNLALAVSACLKTGWLKEEEILKGCELVQGGKNRLFPEKINDSLFFINDSYNSNPLSLINGILFMNELNIHAKYAVIGDMFEINDSDMDHCAREISGLMLKQAAGNLVKLIFYGSRIKLLYSGLDPEVRKTSWCFDDENGRSEVAAFLKKEIDHFPEAGAVYFKASRSARIELLMEDLRLALYSV